MTSLGRVGRILAGTVDVSNSTVEKDTCSTNASSVDISATNTPSSGIDFTTERKKKSSVSSNTNDSSSNDNTSNSTMMLQGEFSEFYRTKYLLLFVTSKFILKNIFLPFPLCWNRTRCDCQHEISSFKNN